MRLLTCVCCVCAQSSALRRRCWRHQLKAAFDLLEAGVRVGCGGTCAAERQKAASASNVVTLRSRMPVLSFVCAVVAALERYELPPGRLGRP